MLKETVLVVVLFIIILVLFRLFVNRHQKAVHVATFSLLIITFGLNVLFLINNYYPNFILDNTTPLGDSHHNLLLYKSDSEYNSEILLDLLQERDISLDARASFYAKFFETYSKSCNYISSDVFLNLNTIPQMSFDLICELPLVYMLDYAFEGNDHLDGDQTPKLYMNLSALENCNNLIAFSDDRRNLYLLTDIEYNHLLAEVDR